VCVCVCFYGKVDSTDEGAWWLRSPDLNPLSEKCICACVYVSG
jgi:hypothetical protein